MARERGRESPFALRWRYLRTLRAVLAALRGAAQQRAGRLGLAEEATERRLAGLLLGCLRAWALLAQPGLKQRAQQHRRSVLQARGFRMLRLYQAWRCQKVQAALRAERAMAMLRARSAWATLRRVVVGAAERRRASSSTELRCRACTVALLRRRALRLWRLDVGARRQARQLACRARAHLSRTVLKRAWPPLVELLHRRRALARLTEPGLRRARQALALRWLRRWRLSLEVRRRQQLHGEEAVLQWYVVLCRSALSLWQKWHQRRRLKKLRQERAARSFAEAQRSTAVRAVLWRFHANCEDHETAAAARASTEQRRRVERASAVARRWCALASARRAADAARPCGAWRRDSDAPARAQVALRVGVARPMGGPDVEPEDPPAALCGSPGARSPCPGDCRTPPRWAEAAASAAQKAGLGSVSTVEGSPNVLQSSWTPSLCDTSSPGELATDSHVVPESWGQLMRRAPLLGAAA